MGGMIMDIERKKMNAQACAVLAARQLEQMSEIRRYLVTLAERFKDEPNFAKTLEEYGFKELFDKEVSK